MSGAWSQLTSPISNNTLQNLLHSSTQWRTQDEQVTWAPHGHTQCTHSQDEQVTWAQHGHIQCTHSQDE